MAEAPSDPLATVEALLREAAGRGFGLLEYAEGSFHLRVAFQFAEGARSSTAGEADPSLPEEGGRALPPPAVPLIVSPGVGFFRRAVPVGQGAVREGDGVEAGAVVALIQAGPLLQPVVAPRAGRLGRPLVEEGADVGFGTALFELI